MITQRRSIRYADRVKARHGSLVLVVLLATSYGCAREPDDAQAPPALGEERDITARPERRGRTTIATEDGATWTVDTIEVDGRVLFEGDIELPQKMGTKSASVLGKRWYAKTVPYVIDPALPHPARVTEAIAHWEAQTALTFVPRTNQYDYVRFVAGRGCSSPMGRQGGYQDVVLQAGERLTSVVGADFAPSGSGAHFYFKDGLYSIGKSYDVDQKQILRTFSVAPGKKAADIVDVAFATNGDVVTWYRDGTYGTGTPSNLGAKQAPAPYALPAGMTVDDVVGIAIAADGRVHAWYRNGTKSEGTASNLAAHASGVAVTLPSGYAATDILGVGIASGTTYAWYRNDAASGGTLTSLAATYAPYTVSLPGHCGTAETIHEIGHAVGLWHEQTRLDRDQYITINWSNIAAASQYNFNKRDNGYDVGPYDYDSIMHYDSYAFSTNGQPTIVKKDGTLIGYAKVLSAGDIAAIGWMYP